MWFDLKKATIYLVDGFGGTAAVNNMAGYAAAAVTMLINGYTGIIPSGAQFTVVGSDAIHTITAHSETMGNTTSITFTPGLTGAVLDDAVITLTGRVLQIKVGEGNLNYSEKRPVEYKRDRGLLDTVREADQEPMDVSLEFTWEFLTASTGDDPTIEDVLKHRGEAADWESSGGDCEPFCLDVRIDYDPDCPDIENERIVLPKFYYESLNHDLKAGNVSVQGKCNATEAIVTRYPDA